LLPASKCSCRSIKGRIRRLFCVRPDLSPATHTTDIAT
jgi:hypothetical protein